VLRNINPHLSISTRIINLLHRSDSLQLPAPHPLQGASRPSPQASCLKAIWALAMVDARRPFDELPKPGQIFLFNLSLVEALNMESLDPCYALPARAAVIYSRRNGARRIRTAIQKLLDDYEIAIVSSQRHIWGTIVDLLREIPADEIDFIFAFVEDEIEEEVDFFADVRDHLHFFFG